MFVVLLELGDNRAKAPDLMESHNQWLDRGFEDGVFVLVGSLPPNRGGGILAHNTTREKLEKRVEEDPFVAAGVVRPRIVELSAWRTIDRLAFLVSD